MEQNELLQELEELEEDRNLSLKQAIDSLKMAGINNSKATLLGMMISNLIRSEINLANCKNKITNN